MSKMKDSVPSNDKPNTGLATLDTAAVNKMMLAGEIPVDANGIPTFGIESFEPVKLIRTWARPTKNSRPLIGLFLKRSDNVRELFPSKYPMKEGDTAYVWAFQLLVNMPADPMITCPIFEGEEPVGGKAGDVIFMFEPRLLRDVMMNANKHQFPMFVRSVDKVPVKSKSYGDVFAWKWEVRRMSEVWTGATAERSSLILPSADAPYLLPEHEIGHAGG